MRQEVWGLLNRYRVLVVLDEIHHCAGGEQKFNAWGQKILEKIQSQASYTLAMTGTPWRSDPAPIVLANYCSPKGKIQCDYIYGLPEAIQDNVCRIPFVELLNHNKIVIKDSAQIFTSTTEAIKSGQLKLRDFILHPEVMSEVVGRGVNKLALMRRNHEQAAGLVVASSVEHASRIKQELETRYKQSVVLVSYFEENSTKIIEDFKTSKTDWIVSIGMVSEGTDIPRLRVTCLLTTIQTEMFFRQVLGRVLRKVVGSPNDDGWLISIATQPLIDFSGRLHVEIPECCSPLLVQPIKHITFDPHENALSAKPKHAKFENDEAEIELSGFVSDLLAHSQLVKGKSVHPTTLNFVLKGPFTQTIKTMLREYQRGECA